MLTKAVLSQTSKQTLMNTPITSTSDTEADYEYLYSRNLSVKQANPQCLLLMV